MTQKQLVFVSEYLKNGNATQAYMTAYGETDEAQAAANGSRLKGNDKVKAAIEQAQQRIMQNTQVTVEAIVEEIKRIAFADIGQVVEWDENGVRIKDSADLTPAHRAIISEITETPTQHGRKKSVKLYNKLTALDALMKHVGGYVTISDIIDRLTEEQLNELAERIIKHQPNENT